MTIWMVILSVIWTLVTVAAYRLGIADGLSAARRGKLAGGKSEKRDMLLEKIEAYDGRKDAYGTVV